MKTRLFFLDILLLASLLVLFCSPVSAFDANDEILTGQLNMVNESPSFGQPPINAPLLNTEVKMSIIGLTARVKVTQLFSNQSPNWMEGTYLFPLPEKSAVDHLEMKIGDRIIVGEIKEKQAAKKIYQQAKISGKKASLVEQHRPNVFSNKVANIAPFENIEITIEYQQDLIYDKTHGFSIYFPMTITQRYTPSVVISEKFADLSLGMVSGPTIFENILLPQKRNSEPGNDVTIEVSLDAGVELATLASTSHAIVKTQTKTSHYLISLAAPQVKAERDFVLQWRPLAGAEPRAALFSETVGDDHYMSLMIMPPTIEESGQNVAAQNLQREVIFVLDTSGSMAGESIKQAKSALLFGLNTLTNGDWFNVIEFNSQTQKLYPQSRQFSASTLSQASHFVSGLTADGGTEMLAALRAALEQTSAQNIDRNHILYPMESQKRVRQVIFLTDGAIGNESQLFAHIENNLNDSRLFTVGIGSAPNEFFMRRAAKFGRGRAIFIADISQSESKINALFEQISAPQLSHINIQWPDNAKVEMWPQYIPDLFTGQPLWIKAKITAKTDSINSQSSPLKIEGRLAQSLWQSELPLTQTKNQHGVAKLWAREKIASIMDNSYHGNLSPEQQTLATNTALEHHLVSRYTSLVAVDKTPARVAQQLYQARMKQVMPAGSAVSTSSASQASSANLHYPKTGLTFSFSTTHSLILLLISLFGLLLMRTFFSIKKQFN